MSDLLHSRSVDDLAGEVEMRRGRIKALKEAIEGHQRAIGDLEVGLLQLLTVDSGEVALAPNGVTARSETGPRGSAAVNTAAIDHHQEALKPLGLAPTERVVFDYPTVDVLRERRAEIMAVGLDPRELVTEPPYGPKLRWQGRQKADRQAVEQAGVAS